MAKRKTTGRSPRPRKTKSNQAPVPVAEPTTVEPEAPPIAMNVPPATEAPPKPEQPQRWTLFSFTVVAALLGVALGFFLGSEATKTPAPQSVSLLAPTATKMEGDRARTVLVMIQEELVENARILKARHEGTADPASPFKYVKNDIWSAVISGSDIQAVQDLDLLRSIATAYRYVDEIKMIDQRAPESSSAAGSGGTASSSLKQISSQAEKSIVEAVVQIDRKVSGKQ